jgi:hypothetical protein
MFNPTHTATFDWAEVKKEFLDSMAGKSTLLTTQPAHGGTIARLKSGSRLDFYGASGDQAVEWVRNGFFSEDFAHEGEWNDERDRRRINFAEEGELDLPLAWSGHDYPYLAWEERKQKPGMQVDVELAFLASTPVKTITEYGAWVASVLARLETDGYDLAVNVLSPSESGVFNRARQTEAKIIVKREGEASDFTEWSALFAPGAFRWLCFTTRAMCCQKWGTRLSDGYGHSYNSGWGVEFDETTRTLTFRRPANAPTFPREMMEQALLDCGIFA